MQETAEPVQLSVSFTDWYPKLSFWASRPFFLRMSARVELPPAGVVGSSSCPSWRENKVGAPLTGARAAMEASKTKVVTDNLNIVIVYSLD